MIQQKECTKCGETKLLTSFYFKKNRSKYDSKCKDCYNIARRKNTNKEEFNRQKNNEILLLSGKKKCVTCYNIRDLKYFYIAKDKKNGYRSSCKECLNKKESDSRIEKNKKKEVKPLPFGLKICGSCKEVKPISYFYLNKSSKSGYTCYCKKCITSKTLKYKENNRFKVLEIGQRYRDNNRLELREKARKYTSTRSKEDVEFKLKLTLRKNLLKAVKKQGSIKTNKTISLLGCDFKTIKAHFSKTFYTKADGTKMTWELFLNGKGTIHIDHIIPCSSFNLTKESEQLKCFHYANLQLLWVEDNLEKSDKLNWIHPIDRKEKILV